MKHLTWVEVNKKNLFDNIDLIEAQTKAEVMYVIKANAYGHGLPEISSLLIEKGVKNLAVQSSYEISTLRNAGFKGRILLIGPFLIENLPEIISYDTEITLFDVEKLNFIENEASKQKREVKIHLKIETGLHRQGIDVSEINNFCRKISACEYVKLDSLSTHFANIEDVDDYEFSRKQFQKLKEVQDKIEALGHKKVSIHAANSGATLMYPEFHGNMVRAGIITYGMFPSNKIALFGKNEGLTLKPVLSWKTRVMRVHELQKGDTVGYGRTYRAQGTEHIALLPVGYYDGYYRHMRNSKVSIQGKLCPII